MYSKIKLGHKPRRGVAALRAATPLLGLIQMATAIQKKQSLLFLILSKQLEKSFD
jgi:hypothetical protein